VRKRKLAAKISKRIEEDPFLSTPKVFKVLPITSRTTYLDRRFAREPIVATAIENTTHRLQGERHAGVQHDNYT